MTDWIWRWLGTTDRRETIIKAHRLEGKGQDFSDNQVNFELNKRNQMGVAEGRLSL